ncbi:hypothetical protein EA658_16535 [Pseudoxanthomonas winnipegensis]|uniref:HTH cro/C1-type domain-containing protein n=1 Tax=Pseudoxanthomonas winnipegensis TaxID=2480810 RepID=A0ABY1WCE6_9GAMM|nr:helix-turn-helix domain-containing protein [Pseudoxanthomonas winnipegensis]TAA11270.1 hypothetical protein EA659_07950 [Pseudoxanthomonas winnipegensis]TAA18693.1 hypothetical protein EA658_16535 [Pseudoxanthomonas winnipegensis]TAH73931.1 hypothetical protein EA657_00210 [Pseudoxanthomonas winnipegensis]
MKDTTFAGRVSEAIKASGLNQSAVANAAGTTKGQVSQWATEGGVKSENIKADVLFRLCDALEVNPRWMLYGTPPMRSVQSQSERLDDGSMAQGLELLYLLADARPEDRRLRRPSWTMIQVAAKAIERADGDPRKAMAEFLAELSKET